MPNERLGFEFAECPQHGRVCAERIRLAPEFGSEPRIILRCLGNADDPGLNDCADLTPLGEPCAPPPWFDLERGR